MATYRKLPVTIDAFKWTGDADQLEDPEWAVEALTSGTAYFHYGLDGVVFAIRTLEGVMLASPGDYIIRGMMGEIYPCKPDIFEMTYETV